jgi:periplasmic protein TonB
MQLLVLVLLSAACSSPGREQAAHDQPGSGPVRISAGIVAPVVIHRVEPHFPEAERKNYRRSGTVLFEGVVGKDGRFRDVKIIRGENDPLAPHMLEAVRQWQFRPALKDGRPVDVIYNLSANIHVR